ncbi:SGNH hydrolase domain-containing protein, partial [Motilimonas sp. KMU-193]|uniref:SGNH hydrolase domain-containing protein n=1 Tax=Motilimonas sp. KMU-193 TaxID=3388668 RepID=UPI00396B0BF4
SNTVEMSKKLDSYLPNHPNLHKVMPQDILCEEGRCKIIDEQYGGLYNGGGHLSYAGARVILGKIFHNINRT